MFRQLRRLASQQGLDDMLILAIKDTDSELLDLLRLQLQHGQKGDGMMPAYANENYAKRKQRMGSKAPFGITDLKLTGAFQDKLKIILTKKGARIRSTDKKSADLGRDYGYEIFQLNQDNQTIYARDILLPALQKRIKNELL